MYHVNMCWATVYSVENEIPYSLKIVNVHLSGASQIRVD